MVIDGKGKIFDDRRKVNKPVKVERRKENLEGKKDRVKMIKGK